MAFVGFWMIPLMFIFSLFTPFISFFENLTGAGQEKLVLPYDPENGIVWEYKEDDYAIINCIKSEAKDGEQIFTFRGKAASDEGRPSGYDNSEVIDDIYFEDENGNIKKYYAFVNFSAYDEGGSLMYGDLDIYEETECLTFEYTVKAKTEAENGYWHIDDRSAKMHQNRFIGEEKLENVYERTYRFVFAPEDIKDHTFKMVFYYKLSVNNTFEKIEVTFELVGKEVKVVEENHFVVDENYNYVEVK